GGLSLEDVDTRTMRSKQYENLNITGDLLHIGRPSGGYSLQLCWTTGYVAGENARRAFFDYFFLRDNENHFCIFGRSFLSMINALPTRVAEIYFLSIFLNTATRLMPSILASSAVDRKSLFTSLGIILRTVITKPS
ncbi:MAG: NAD(P)/FAD-dependent oxidoreductase, partial [bacterium]|nr:NAD(P)/FAD-dependent oxidoreductase [bacterium]